VGFGLFIIEFSRSHSDTPHFVRLVWWRDWPVAETSTWPHTTLTKTNIHSLWRDSNHQSQTQASDRAATGIDLSDLIDSKWATVTCHANTFPPQTHTTAWKNGELVVRVSHIDMDTDSARVKV